LSLLIIVALLSNHIHIFSLNLTELLCILRLQSTPWKHLLLTELELGAGASKNMANRFSSPQERARWFAHCAYLEAYGITRVFAGPFTRGEAIQEMAIIQRAIIAQVTMRDREWPKCAL